MQRIVQTIQQTDVQSLLADDESRARCSGCIAGLLCQDFSKYWSIGAGVLTSSLDKKDLCEYMPSNNQKKEKIKV